MNVRVSDSHPSKAGSSLLLTVLAVSLLIVVVLTFTILVRMELRAVQNQLQLQAARANARLGVELGVARLQELAGSDTRITLPAQADAQIGSAVPPENRHWAGVRDAAPWVWGPTNAPPAVSTNQNYRSHLGWLISGNPDPRTFQPYTVSGGAISVDTNAVLLVGPGSVGEADRNSNGVPDDFVAAPLEVSRVPGGGAVGHFAYVTSDEGVKARVNLLDGFRGVTNRFSLASSQRGAMEYLVPDFQVTDPGHQAFLGRVSTRGQVGLLAGALGMEHREGTQEAFHDVTLSSRSLPANVRYGGLKRDLMAVAVEARDVYGSDLALAANAPDSQLNRLYAYQERKLERQRLISAALRTAGIPPYLFGLAQRDEQFHPNLRVKTYPPSSDIGVRYENGGPSWRQVLSFMLSGERSNSGVDPDGQYYVQAGVGNENNHELSPVMLRLHLNQYYTLTPENGNYILRLHFCPAIALWNPHNVRLKTQDLFFQNAYTLPRDGYTLFFQVSHPQWRNGTPAWLPPYQLYWKGYPDSFLDGDIRFLFRIPATTLEAGEAVWFELDQHHKMTYTRETRQRNWGGQNYDMDQGNAGGFTALGLPYPSSLTFPNMQTTWVQVGAFDNPADQEDSYLPMVRGLQNYGGFSIYAEENLTWKTKMEARGLVPPARTGADSWNLVDDAWLHDTPNRPFIVPQPPTGKERWDSSRNPPNWEDAHVNYLAYPSTFTYAEVDDPTTLKTVTFPTETHNGQTYFVGTNITVFAPMDLSPGTDSDRGILGRRDRGHINSRWLKRSASGNFRTEDLEIPLSYNEHGIITEFPINPINVDLTGITPDWNIEKVMFGGMSDTQSGGRQSGRVTLQNNGRNNLDTDVLFLADPTHSNPGSDGSKIPAFAAFDFSTYTPPELGSSDPWSLTHLLPTIAAPDQMARFSTSDPFINSPALYPLYPLWGYVFAMRQPDHGMLAYNRDPLNPVENWLLAKTPWVSHYNPRAALQATDLPNEALAMVHNVGFRMPPSFLGGFLLNDQNQMLPTVYSPDREHAYVGHSSSSTLTDRSNGAPRATLADVPARLDDLGNLGQLTHGNFHSFTSPHPNAGNSQKNYSGVETRTNPDAGHRSSLAFGSSWAEPTLPTQMPYKSLWPTEDYFLESDGVTVDMDKVFDYATPTWGSNYPILGAVPENGNGNYIRNVANNMALGWTGGNGQDTKPLGVRLGIDDSWYLNHALWDDFFLSSDGNGRLRWQAGTPDRDVDLSAARSWIEGGFNVHSISVPAWASLLAGFLDLDVENQSGLSDDRHDASERVPLARSLNPVSPAFSPGGAGDDYSTAVAYEGYRRLTLADIWDWGDPSDPNDDTGLAVEIVRVIQERGPFYSLADFVNRSLLTEAQDPGVHRLMGPLQEAIERSGINGQGIGYDAGDPTSIVGADDYISDASTRWQAHNLAALFRSANTDAPSLIGQADLMAKLGGVLQVRSDTFRIRAYGDLSPDGTQTTGRAWCEVVVQRSGSYVDPANPPEAGPEELSLANQRFGRRFDIIDFRWLSPEEL